MKRKFASIIVASLLLAGTNDAPSSVAGMTSDAASPLSAPVEYDCGDFTIRVLSSPERVVMTSGKRMFPMVAAGDVADARYEDAQGNAIWGMAGGELRLRLVWEGEARTCVRVGTRKPE
jgi:hypothetical protein